MLVILVPLVERSWIVLISFPAAEKAPGENGGYASKGGDADTDTNAD